MARASFGDRPGPLVTIAIPTYNRADSYLRFALESALGQTYPYLDVIVSDNASTDDTEKVVRTFADPRLRYFRHTRNIGGNIGANKNANFCLQQATGDYFLLLHDDDMIDRDFVEACMKAANYAPSIGVILTGTRIIDSGGFVLSEARNNIRGLPTDGFMLGWFEGKIALYLCSTLFNTKRLREMGGLQSKHQLVEDGVAIFQLAAKYGRVDVHDVKATFRLHSSQMTFSTPISDWCEDYLLLLDLMCDLVPENKEKVRREGMRFFSSLNYNRAIAIRSPMNRLIGCLTVFRKFNFRQPPRLSHIHSLLYGTWVYYGLRFVKRGMTKIAASV